jgi:hypothetical protein
LTRRSLRAAILAGGTVLMALWASPASATVTGGCQGSGTLNGTTYNAGMLDPDKPITIPEEGDVSYQGSVPLPAGDTDRAYSGKIDLALPLGGGVTVADWSGSSKKVSESGVHHYSVPALVPRGVTVQASGVHNHDGLSQPCRGKFSVTLDGGPLDSPVPTAAAAGGTIITGAALAMAGRLKGVMP